jgi:predicted ATPase with chaperone activity
MEELSLKTAAAPGEEALAPRPATLVETGLSGEFVTDLVLRLLYARGAHELLELSRALALAGSVLEPLINDLRYQAKVESTAEAGRKLYRLTDRGRRSAQEAFVRCAYVGPAPVPLDRYSELTAAQSFKGHLIRRDSLQSVLGEAVIEPEMLDKLGPALHSARPALIYGPAGTGKTFIAKQLIRAFGDSVLVPHALIAGGDVIRLFDPAVHHKVTAPEGALAFAAGEDPRFVRCKRPLVVTGGELTMDMLDLKFGTDPGVATAPVQMKSANGVLLIDDLGRQRVEPDALFNRWIIPLEEKRDFLVDSTGHHISVPFETLLIFSTNLNPNDLADDAFLRRLGEKIRFEYCTRERFRTIWNRVCMEAAGEPEDALLDTLISEYYEPSGRPLAPCHPRDLVDLAVSFARYRGDRRLLSEDSLAWAWDNYFVNDAGEGTVC